MPHTDNQTPEAAPAQPRAEFWRQVFSNTLKQSRRDIDLYDKFPRLYREGEFGQPRDPSTVGEHSGGGLTANFTFAYINLVTSMMLTNDPKIHVMSRKGQASTDRSFAPLVQAGLFKSMEEARHAYAETIRNVEDYIYQETGSQLHNEAVLFDAITRGQGISKEGWDPEFGISRIDAIKRHELYFDPHARYSLSQGQYVVHTSILPIEQARAFFAKFNIPPGEIESNFTIQDGEDLTSQTLSKSEQPSPDKLFKFHEVWFKDGDNRRLMYRHFNKDAWITTDPQWPFILDHDEFPFSLLTFNQQYGTLSDAFTQLYAVEGLRKTYEQMIQYWNNHVKRSISKKIFVDAKRIDSDMLDQLKSPVDLQIIPVKGNDKRPMRDIIEVVDFNAGSGDALELAAGVKRIKDEILGADELLRGGEISGRISATEASVRDENSKIRATKAQIKLDAFLINQLRHRTQIDRQLTSPEKVAKISGQRSALLWALNSSNVEDLISEYSITIQAGSTGERARRRRMEVLDAQFEQAQLVNQQANGLPIFNLTEMHKARSELNGDPDPSRFINEQMAEFVNQGGLFAQQTEAEAQEAGQ